MRAKWSTTGRSPCLSASSRKLVREREPAHGARLVTNDAGVGARRMLYLDDDDDDDDDKDEEDDDDDDGVVCSSK
jgi:hypothetical protein